MRKNLLILGCLALALGACKGEEKKATGGSAQGEVLPGSASDAMLPLDTVKSQAPLAPKADGGDKPDTKDRPKPASAATPAKPAEPAEPAAAADAGEE